MPQPPKTTKMNGNSTTLGSQRDGKKKKKKKGWQPKINAPKHSERVFDYNVALRSIKVACN